MGCILWFSLERTFSNPYHGIGAKTLNHGLESAFIALAGFSFIDSLTSCVEWLYRYVSLLWLEIGSVDASRSCASNPGRRLQNAWLVVKLRIVLYVAWRVLVIFVSLRFSLTSFCLSLPFSGSRTLFLFYCRVSVCTYIGAYMGCSRTFVLLYWNVCLVSSLNPDS